MILTNNIFYNRPFSVSITNNNHRKNISFGDNTAYYSLFPPSRVEYGDLALYYRERGGFSVITEIGFITKNKQEGSIRFADAVDRIAKAKEKDESLLDTDYYSNFLTDIARALDNNPLGNLQAKKAMIGYDVFAVELEGQQVIKLSMRDILSKRRTEDFDVPVSGPKRLGEAHYYIQPVVDIENVTAEHIQAVIDMIVDAGYEAHDISATESRDINAQVGLYQGEPRLIDRDCAAISS